MNQTERRKFLIQELLKEQDGYRHLEVPKQEEEQKQLLRGLMNIRPACRISKEVLQIQDAYLTEETVRKGITHSGELDPIQPGIYLWKGDITTLACDAIVNAANSGMTGCYVPNHRCIDNCIHTFAGMELRLECDRIMREQGYEEPTGQAKLTQAYNLPCRYILHTVGPIVTGKLTKTDYALLASCYRSCLELAAENGLESVAFCCVSTGEFGFPKEEAAQIAVQSVQEFMKGVTSVKKVIFNVFQEEDQAIYNRILRAGRTDEPSA